MVNDSGVKITDHVKICNMFNEYFAEIGQKMAAKITRSPSSYNLPVNPVRCS